MTSPNRTVWTASRADLIQALERVTRERNHWRDRAQKTPQEQRRINVETAFWARKLAEKRARAHVFGSFFGQNEAQNDGSTPISPPVFAPDPHADRHRAELYQALREPPDRPIEPPEMKRAG